MTPLPAHYPILWRTPQRACILSVSRAELERRLGPAPDQDGQEEDLGPRHRWAFRCDCGLELLIELPHPPAQEPREAVMWMEDLEVEHALAHLGLSTNQVLWRADMEEPLSLDGWAVIRQDDAGNRFDICVLSVRAHAECLARLMEARAHKQSYDVEPRGMPPLREEPPQQGWDLHSQAACP